MSDGKVHLGGAVVVGVDGSAGAREALRWALAEARLRRTQLRVVHALKFDYPVEAGEGSLFKRSVLDSFNPFGDKQREIREAAEALLERAIAELSEDADGLEIERQVVAGGPAEVLVNAVGGNDLLVVGSRGQGGFTGLLLGSVSHQCAQHAPCPVAIVHPRVDPCVR